MHFQENFVKLAELQRDLGGYEHLLSTDREFVREGCLQKLSRKGYQQRMFFLVSKPKIQSYQLGHHLMTKSEILIEKLIRIHN